MDAFDESADRAAQVNEQVGWCDEVLNFIEKIAVAYKVSLGHKSHLEECGGEDVYIFIDGSILHSVFPSVPNACHFCDAAIEEVYLHVEPPPLHVSVEVGDIGVCVWVFVVRLPAEMLGKQLGERCFPRADIPGDGNVFCLHTLESFFADAEMPLEAFDVCTVVKEARHFVLSAQLSACVHPLHECVHW